MEIIMKHHLVIIYDGIENSVFAGQVLAPLVQKLHNHPEDRGLIISFEKSKPSLASITAYTNIDCIVLRKIRFFGSLSMYYAAYQLRKVLSQYTIASIVVRGPLAACILAYTNQTVPCIVQARGLAAQEYAYAHDENQSWFIKKVHQFRTYQYEAIERYVYGSYAQQAPIMIRAVSESLRAYIIATFGTPPAKITVEAADIPKTIPSNMLQTWRSSLRTALHITEVQYVYVYNGSAKAWQCPQETVAYFAEQYAQNHQAFLLILTQDTAPFITLCTQYRLPQNAYHIMHVQHNEIYRYLAVADAGIIFRKPHIINWVSRPTKILEYQAVGLKIIHNNTVAMLQEK